MFRMTRTVQLTARSSSTKRWARIRGSSRRWGGPRDNRIDVKHHPASSDGHSATGWPSLLNTSYFRILNRRSPFSSRVDSTLSPKRFPTVPLNHPQEDRAHGAQNRQESQREGGLLSA